MRRKFETPFAWVLIMMFVFSSFSGSAIIPPNTTLEKSGKLQGVIIEANSNTPLEYANIAIYSSADSSLVGGGIADSDGKFTIKNLNPGKYYLDAKFIGYEHTYKSDISLHASNMHVDLGMIELFPASESIDEVTVKAQERPIMYEIDKKVIDPAQFPTAANGTATDVLANTPSVTVDIEGNVTLRGSSSFTVLIDGRPTPFDPADALDQIPASTIRNIEIITNPSAKYDPDGNAGIININTKKSKLVGISGILNASADSYGSITGDFLMNYKLEKFNFFLSGNRSNRYGQGKNETLNMTYGEDTITTSSVGIGERGRSSFSVKTGFDFFPNDYNTLSFNVSLNGRDRKFNKNSDYHEFSTSGYDLTSFTESSSDGGGDNVAFSLDYRKTFEKDGQELTAFAYYETGSGKENSYFEQFNGSHNLLKGQNSWEEGDGKEMRFKLDYVHPFTEKYKLEAGYQLRSDRDYEWNDVHWYTEDDNYEPSSESDYFTETDFYRDIHALYSTFSSSGNVFGYQLGLRTEYTNRSFEYSAATETFTIDRWDFFPTAHISFQLPAEQQFTTSYTRRIERPRGYYLEPFLTYMDAYNVRTGNPDIQPEYINSYEFGYQKTIGKGFLSAEVYHRNTTNKIERITDVYQDNVMIRTVDNIGEDFSTGLEFMWNMNPTKWWMINLMGNAYFYKVEGMLKDESITAESKNWHSRMGNTFSIKKNTKVQFDMMYHSPTATAQGKREGFMFTNLAVRQDFLEKKLNVTLSVRDVLNTAKFGFESSGDNFYTSRKFDMKSPVFAITLSYKINNYRAKKQVGEGEGQGGSINMDGGDF